MLARKERVRRAPAKFGYLSFAGRVVAGSPALGEEGFPQRDSFSLWVCWHLLPGASWNPHQKEKLYARKRVS
jgi:hypothetical protein